MRKLSEAAAVVIALKWAALMVDRAGHCLLFTKVRADLLPVLDVWVTGKRNAFAVDKDALAALRETLGVWRALSCCRGFGGYENPRFWDKVVRQLMRDYGNGGGRFEEQMRPGVFHDEIASPSCATLSFNLNGYVSRSGRNKERVGAWMRDVCRELFQLCDDVEKAPLSADYERVLRQLQPFIDRQRFAREPIAVRLTFQSKKEDQSKYMDSDLLDMYAVILNEIAAKPKRNDVPVETPVLTMESVSFSGASVSTKQELEALTALMKNNSFPIPTCPTLKINLDPGAFSQFVTTALQIKDLSERRSVVGEQNLTAQGKLETMVFFFSTANRHPLACLYSALPHARALLSLRVMELAERSDWEWTKFECYWLAYACFHPRSRTSSWESFMPLLATMTDKAREALEEIQRDPGIALSITRLAVVTGVVTTSEARSDRLQIVTVDNGATIYAEPSVNAATLITVGDEAELEMCDLHAQDWHCVLVPGYSFGWIQASGVVGTRDWTPEGPLTSSIKQLHMPPSFSIDDAMLLLSVVGSAVETLGMLQGCSSGSILEKLALRCPNLKSLEVGTQGEQLSQHSLKRFFSSTTGTLESLSINWDSCNAPFLLKILSEWTHKEAVKRLKKLQLSRITSRKCGPAQMASLEAMLKANRSLEQLVIEADDDHSSWDMRAPGVGLEEHNGEDIYRDQNLKQRLAFLSVMKRHCVEHQRCYQALDSTVLAKIFDFAIPAVRRLVYLPRVMMDYG